MLDQADTGCGPGSDVFTAVAVWTAEEQNKLLEDVCSVALFNSNRLVVVGIGTQSPALSSARHTGTEIRTSDMLPRVGRGSHVRIASLQDMRALRYVPCRGGEFCFLESDVPYAVATNTEELSSTSLKHTKDREAVLMAAKVVWSCVVEGFVPWSLDKCNAWQTIFKLVRPDEPPFANIVALSAEDCATAAESARQLGDIMATKAEAHLVRTPPHWNRPTIHPSARCCAQTAMDSLELVHSLGSNCFATCLDHEELRSGFVSAVGEQDLEYRRYSAAADWVEEANKNYREVLAKLRGAMSGEAHLEPALCKQQVALASAWLAQNPRLSCTAAVLGGDSLCLSRRVTWASERLQGTGVLASSGRAGDIALLTQCSKVLGHLSGERMHKLPLLDNKPGWVDCDQNFVENLLGSLVANEIGPGGRLCGLVLVEGTAHRVLAIDDTHYHIPERWVRLFLSDYVQAGLESRLPWGVVLFCQQKDPPSMDTKDPLCGLSVCLKRVEKHLVLEPSAVATCGAL